MDDPRERPTLNQPLNAAPRRAVKPAIIVFGILALVILAMIVIGWLRYNT
jgi:predicted nucleic acid-binding Zn ribbon protein